MRDPSERTSPESKPGAVVIGGYVNALTTVRALALRGVPSTVISTRDADMAQYSRYVQESVRVPRFHAEPERLLALLEDRADIWKGRVLMPTNDEALEVLSRHRVDLERTYRVAAPEWSIAGAVVDKDRLYSLAREIGVPVAGDYGSADRRVLMRPDLTFPLLVKPCHGYRFHAVFGKKVVLVQNRKELETQIGLLDQYGFNARVMDLIPGPDSECYNFTCYRDGRGDIRGAFRVRKVRKSPPQFGVGRVARPTEETGFEEPARKLLDSLGWHGIASLEFKRDPRDGRLSLLDFNGRCFLMAGVALCAGINYAHMAWSEAVGHSLEDPCPNDWDGCWIHFLDDLYYSLLRRDLERLTLSEFFAPYLHSRAFAVASWQDPKPFLAEIKRGIAILLRGNGPDGQ